MNPKVMIREKCCPCRKPNPVRPVTVPTELSRLPYITFCYQIFIKAKYVPAESDAKGRVHDELQCKDTLLFNRTLRPPFFADIHVYRCKANEMYNPLQNHELFFPRILLKCKLVML
jgi:hypothetical protein